jgi:hypothetical protein
MIEAYLEHANGEYIGESIKLDKKEILVGRLPDCDIIIEPKFTSVSQHHAILRKVDDNWAIIDIGTRGKGSTYGTFINGTRIIANKGVFLDQDDDIRLGTQLGKYFRYHAEGTILESQLVSLQGRLNIDVNRRILLLDGRPMSIVLTRQEYEFLLILWRKTGYVCYFKDICSNLWPGTCMMSRDIDADLKVRINTLAHGLRRKLNVSLDGINIIESCRGVGYRLRF